MYLRGIFLTSADPARTARFYQQVAGLELETVQGPATYVYWKIDRDGLQLAIHDAAKFAAFSDPPLAESNRTHLYFKIASQKEFLKRLDQLNVTVLVVDDIVVTVVDPDGRKVMFGTA